MFARADETESLIYDLPSILERIELPKLFAKAQPLEVELGAGDGSFLVNYAKLHPERNFIGVERLWGRIKKIHRKGSRLGLTNIRGVRIESAYFLQYLLPRESVSALHIYFPDPWPKRKHVKNRLVSEGFPDLAAQTLAPDGIVYLRTDDRNYFEQMLAVFGASRKFCAMETPDELKRVVTDFEAEFNAQGIPTNYAAYRKI
ncbi:MAG TPA: tRNA (guanosine(46)-N7)-methyltransferase TrmB [Candidatus Paceibacterota bacterium]|nr:tRNA (guanosine(46)-N7)-methyltransferase TrmB [Candidatus Paceibacterota bacterium]